MALDIKDLEQIEKLIYKNGDDIAISISRSFERLEERIDAMESRTLSRFLDAEDKLEGVRDDLNDEIGDVKAEIRDFNGSMKKLLQPLIDDKDEEVTGEI